MFQFKVKWILASPIIFVFHEVRLDNHNDFLYPNKSLKGTEDLIQSGIFLFALERRALNSYLDPWRSSHCSPSQMHPIWTTNCASEIKPHKIVVYYYLLYLVKCSYWRLLISRTACPTFIVRCIWQSWVSEEAYIIKPFRGTDVEQMPLSFWVHLEKK